MSAWTGTVPMNFSSLQQAACEARMRRRSTTSVLRRTRVSAVRDHAFSVTACRVQWRSQEFDLGGYTF